AGRPPGGCCGRSAGRSPRPAGSLRAKPSSGSGSSRPQGSRGGSSAGRCTRGGCGWRNSWPPPREPMLARRVIPCLDVDAGRVVKGTSFTDLRDAGDPVELAVTYDREGADEVIFLDITASHERRGIMEDVVRRTAEVLTIPFTVGGGLRTVEDLRRMLGAGADKVGINTAAVERPELIREAALRFGSQCIVVAIDARRLSADRWEVYTHGGRTPTGR